MVFPENEGVAEIGEDPIPSPSVVTPSPMTLPPPAFTPEKVLHVLRDVVFFPCDSFPSACFRKARV